MPAFYERVFRIYSKISNTYVTTKSIPSGIYSTRRSAESAMSDFTYLMNKHLKEHGLPPKEAHECFEIREFMLKPVKRYT
jgi:hypothetical protein